MKKTIIILACALAAFTIPLLAAEPQAEEKTTVQPTIVTKKLRLAGYEGRIELKDEYWPEMDTAKNALKANLEQIKNKVQPVRPIGFWTGDPDVDYSDKANHSKRMYFFCVEVSSLDEVPAGCIVRDLLESLFAVFREEVHGSAEKWEWLKASEYCFNPEAAPGDFEVFDDFEHIDIGSWEIWVPIRKKNNE